MKTHYCTEQELQQKLQEYKHLYNNNGQQTQQNQASLSHYIKTINNSLNFMHLIIKSTKDPITQKVYYGLVNDLDDEIAKLHATELTEQETGLMRDILKRLVEEELDEMSTRSSTLTTEDSGVYQTELLNVRSAKVSIQDMELLIQRLLDDGWLQWVGTTRRIWFGVRTLLELRGFLSDQFGYDPLE